MGLSGCMGRKSGFGADNCCDSMAMESNQYPKVLGYHTLHFVRRPYACMEMSRNVAVHYDNVPCHEARKVT